MIKNKINIFILIIITSIILFHFINFTKPISGNPIVYNLCAKELANNFELSLFYSGLSNPFYCNFHSMLSTFLLALPYKIFGSTVLVSKIFNFFIVVIYFFYLFEGKI